MGQSQSNQSVGPDKAQHSTIDISMISTFWDEAVASNEMSKDHLRVTDFVQSIGSHPFGRDIFQYLALDNETVERHFFISRIADLMKHADFQWDSRSSGTSLFSTILSTPDVVLGIAMDSEKPMPCEATSVSELCQTVHSLSHLFDLSILQILFPSKYATRGNASTGLADSKILSSLQRRLLAAVLSNPIDESNMVYQSSRDGLSYRVLASSVRHYPGSLLFVFRDSDARIYAVHCNRGQWDETNGNFDQSALDTVFLQIEPELRVRRVKPRGSTNCAYFNASNIHHFMGVAFGGREPTFRFSLSGSDFPTVRSLDFDATFAAGQLLSSMEHGAALTSEVTSRVVVLEIHGLGGQDARYQQDQKKATETEARMDRKRVDVSRMVENQFDREILFPKTFAAQPDRLGNS